MKKTALLMSLVAVSAVAGGSFAYGWHSVIANNQKDASPMSTTEPAVPLQQDAVSESVRSDPSISAQQAISQQLSGSNDQVSLTLDESQLNQLVSDALLSQPQSAQILANASSFQTKLRRDRVETGTVLNLAELPREDLSADISDSIDQLINAAPMLANRDIYVGLVARPQVQDGQIDLSQDVNIKLGQFTFPLADVAEQMGFSTDAIEQRLNTLLSQQGLILETVEVLDNQLIIKGVRS
ncbi:MAG: hypothetical protein ACFB2W_22310 [Leptolyngbyaceae cyanobacterium]